MTESPASGQTTLPEFVEPDTMDAVDPEPGSANPAIGTVAPTGITGLDVSVRVGRIHLLGVLHKQPLAIARLVGAITRYEPDVVAVEAKGEAIRQYHPDVCDPRWPPRDELEAAAFATAGIEELAIAGIDTYNHDQSADFEAYDREIFAELGIIDSEDYLTRESYYELDLPTIRKWRELTRERDPEAFEAVLADRDDVMAGHLQALYEHDAIDTIVAVVGVQHVAGLVDRLRQPNRIPEELVEFPPWHHYNILTPAPW